MTPRTSAEAPATPKPEPKPDAQDLRKLVLEAVAADLDELATLIAGTTDATILGDNEFAIRDIVHRVGAKAIETALRERKKGGTSVRA